MIDTRNLLTEITQPNHGAEIAWAHKWITKRWPTLEPTRQLVTHLRREEREAYMAAENYERHAFLRGDDRCIEHDDEIAATLLARAERFRSLTAVLRTLKSVVAKEAGTTGGIPEPFRAAFRRLPWLPVLAVEDADWQKAWLSKDGCDAVKQHAELRRQWGLTAGTFAWHEQVASGRLVGAGWLEVQL